MVYFLTQFISSKSTEGGDCVPAIRVMIASSQCEKAKAWLENLLGRDVAEIVCAAQNGEEALHGMASTRPQMLVFDWAMLTKHGSALFERLDKVDEARRPAVMVMPVSQHQAGAYGTQTERLRLLCSAEVSSALLHMGMPTHVEGYDFALQATLIALSNPQAVQRMTRQVYPRVAQLFGTQPYRVERAIRYAIALIWERDAQNMAKTLGYRAETCYKPSNGEFIAQLAERTRLRVWRRCEKDADLCTEASRVLRQLPGR